MDPDLKTHLEQMEARLQHAMQNAKEESIEAARRMQDELLRAFERYSAA